MTWRQMRGGFRMRRLLGVVASASCLVVQASAPAAGWATFAGKRNGAIGFAVYFCYGCSVATSEEPSDPDSYAINPDGSGLRHLALDRTASFSPDGHAVLLEGSGRRVVEARSGKVLARWHGLNSGW